MVRLDHDVGTLTAVASAVSLRPLLSLMGRSARRRRTEERYRQAADDALQQLDWCIGYRHGIRKMRISRALAHNRTIIRS